MKKKIWLIIILGLIIRLAYLFKHNPIWWDGAVYLGMGKYLFSLGQIGLWEPLRPLVFPLILGTFWKLNLNPILFGRILEIFFSLGSVYLVYLIGKTYKNEFVGLIAATLLCFTPIFFDFSFRLYTEIPSTFFALSAIYLFMKKNLSLSAIFCALAFLTKFPQGLVLLTLGLFSFKKIKDTIKFGTIFLISILPYLIFNYLKYNSIFQPLIDGNYIIKNAGVWIFIKPWWYYFSEILNQNILYIFAVIGIILTLKYKHKYIPIIFTLIFIYFTRLAHKEPRFIILFLPYLAIFAAIGINSIFKKKWVYWIVLGISLVILILNINVFPDQYQGRENFFNYLNDKEINNTIIVSHPYIGINKDVKSLPMYYMVFNSELADYWLNYINENYKEIDYIFFDTCEGGTICPPTDEKCKQKQEELITLSKTLFEVKLEETRGNCRYFIFSQEYR
jgi:4-amino-4-deoxy-L-arabinose transferase-like glycosyltransferase